MEIVLTHLSSDFDGLGATVAAAKLHPDALPVLQSQLDASVRAYADLHKDALHLVEAELIDLQKVNRVILVDTRSPKRLGRFEPLANRPDVAWEIYDHHPRQPGDLPGAAPAPRAGSATAMLVAELERRAIALTPIEATTMALGVYADTGNLTYPSTTPTDARAIAYLLANDADLAVVNEFAQTPLTPAQRELLDELSQATPEEHHGLRTLVVGASREDDLPGLAAVAGKLEKLLTLDVLLMAVQLEGDRLQIVARSASPAVDLLQVLVPFGGRGHTQAASAHARGVPLDTAIATLRRRLLAALPTEPSAEDLMSAPVRTIPSDTRADEAHARLVQTGHTGLLVTEDGRVVGLVSRRDLDRALHHGLAHVPVKGFMTRELVTVAPDAPLSEIQALLVAHDIGRLPVMRDGALLGIVTRTDVLRVLYARQEASRRAVKRALAEAADKLRTLWPESWRSLVEQAGETAGDRPLYLVGGAVRDLLLGRRNLDVDLVLDAPAIPFAKELARQFPGTKLTPHERFGTAQLLLPDGRKLDVATARTEYYTHPGALPTVEFSSIKHDLTRRDFSVNALALRLNPTHFGEVLDFFDAGADLASGALRVLHNLSFVEDPTRLLRAVRFERQLAFRLAPESERYALAAMHTGRFDALGGERNKVEWRRLLSAPDPLPAIRRLAELEALRLLDPAIAPDTTTWALLTRARRLFAILGDRPEAWRWLTYLTILLHVVRRDRVQTLLQRLQLSQEDQQVVLGGLAAAERLSEETDWPDYPPAARYHLWEEFSGPARLYAALTDTPRGRRTFIEDWRQLQPVRLHVSGEALKALGLPPGPRYGEILRAVLDARLNGEVATPEQERHLLERLAREK
ncbi:MAG TPA: CBS domain-containing protein [Oscillatoriaceae cyanobacterium]